MAICELGDTHEATVEQPSDPNFQRRLAAFGADSGRMATEIRKVTCLKQPAKVLGQGGVFATHMCPNNVTPDGWMLAALASKTKCSTHDETNSAK